MLKTQIIKRQMQGSVDARTCKIPNLRLFSETLNRVSKEIHTYDVNEIFQVELRGKKFNALPFLLSGSSYFDAACYGWMLNELAKTVPIKKDITIKEFSGNKLIEAKVFNALLPGQSGTRELMALLFVSDQSAFVRLFYRSSARALNKVIVGRDFSHFRYSVSGLCNTQAFCFYLTIYWLVNVDPMMRKSIDPDLRRTNFVEILEMLCPVDSIHWKYIAGEITADELVRFYDHKKFSDGSTVAVREAYSNATRGSYDGRPMTKEQIAVGRETVNGLFVNSELAMNLHLSYAYLYGGGYDGLKADYERSKSECSRSKDAEARAVQRYNKSADECRSLRQVNNDLKSQIHKLEREIASHTTDDELRNRISQLERELKSALAEGDKLFAERLELRQELSQRAKQVKKLSAQVGVSEEIVVEEVEQLAEVSLEEMISALCDKRIVMVGGDISKECVKTFEDWGFRHFKNMSGKIRKAQCDFLVVCSILCSHEDMYRAEKALMGSDTQLVLVKSVNAEMILRALWEAQG